MTEYILISTILLVVIVVLTIVSCIVNFKTVSSAAKKIFKCKEKKQ